MKTIHVVCEGQTEANFVNKVLNPYFLGSNKILIPVIVVTKTDRKVGRQYKGGMKYFTTAENTIEKYIPLLKKDNVFLTTMFDFYALPNDAPGMNAISSKVNPYDKVLQLEQSLYDKYPSYKFIPYYQLHEFEALIFSNLDKLSEVYYDYNIKELYDCTEKIKNPELINNGAETAPSKRILKCIPVYDKVTMGVQVLMETEISLLREKCSHFNDWITKLEEI